uniref:Condensin complex subunit 1 n=1 Tax=Lygus hesperus TaxID=30085 RepID=A0A146L071_LYGHE
MDEKWDFNVPLQKEDLQKEAKSQYHVEVVFDLQKSLKKAKALKNDVASQGCISILEHFDVLYSVFCHSDVNFVQLQEVYDLTICRYLLELKGYVQESLVLEDPASKQQSLNAIKMILYVFSLFVKTYEDKLAQNADNFISEPKIARKKGKGKVRPEELWDWTEYKMKAFRLVLDVLSFNISSLWPNLVADEPFVNMLANCCYKCFENPDIIQAKNKSLKDTISQVMAILVSQYNHGMTFISRAVELVKKNENTVPAISNSVMIIVREHKCTSVLPRLLSEFNDILQVEDITGLSKSVSIFITDIAETYPELLHPCVPILTKNLIVEPYAVRNATLIAFCEVLLKCLVGELREEDLRLRQKLLKYLHNHLRDQNAYVRSKVLQLWAKLAGAHAIPKYIISDVTKTAMNRINDKSAFVVKSAVQFFCVLLKQNPFAGKLKISQLEQELFQAKAALHVIDSKRTLSREETWRKAEPEIIVTISKRLDEEGDVETTEDITPTQSINVQDVMTIIAKLVQEGHYSEAYTCLRQSEVQFPNAKEIRCNMDDNGKAEYYKNVLKKVFMKAPDGSEQILVEFDCFTEEYEKQKKIVEYAEEATAFAKLMCSVCEEVGKVMKGKSLLEVLEAIDFFTTAYQFGLPNARPVIREILGYVKCKQPGVKEAVVAAYKTLYLNTAQPTPRGRALQVAQRLIKLLKDLDYEQKMALEDLVQEWVANKELDNEFIHVLWEKYSKKQTQTTEEESVAALILLNMIAGSNPALVSSNLSVFLDIGLSNSSSNMCVTETCKALMKLGGTKQDGKFVRCPSDDPMFEKSVFILVDRFSKPNQEGFLQMALTIIKMIFKLSSYPEKIADKLLMDCYNTLCQNSEESSGAIRNSSQRSQNSISTEVSVKEMALARLFHIYGEIIFRKWVYFDHDVINSLKKPESELGKKKMVTEDDDEEMDEFESDNREAEDDAVINAVSEICEKLVLDDDTITSHIRDMVVNCCRGVMEPVSVSLQTAAATCLAKLMMVSHEFCENNIQLYVTLMEKSKEETVRSNLVFGVGDLLCRFPNIVEPWTSHIYARLKDESPLVRKNTVVVLCHLITREMIKVRGQIAEVCLCLEDPEPDIRAQVQSLLVDLSQKGNTLYNIIVDIISRLSNPDRPDLVSSEVFNRIMKFTLGLIGKERQNELLVEKICVRLKEATLERQWQDLAFCLSQLSYNEKSLRKLFEALSTLNERLLCSEVQSAITGIIGVAMKSINKPQLREIAQECQAKLDELLSVKKDNSAADTTQVPPPSSDPVEDKEMEEVFSTPRKPPPARSGRSTSTRLRKRK